MEILTPRLRLVELPGQTCVFGLHLREAEADGAIVGTVSLRLADDGRTGELGLEPTLRGRGLAVEAAAALAGFGFRVLGLERIDSPVDTWPRTLLPADPPATEAYAIVPAREKDVPLLGEIERAASRLFVGQPVTIRDWDETSDPEDLEDSREEGLLFVALDPAGDAVGFAVGEPLGRDVHLDELDVHPDHGRRGLGAALVRAVVAAARARGARCVTLTTFRDLPWNAPFYARLGFRTLDSDALPPDLAPIFREENARGLAADERCVMRLDLEK